MILNRPLAACYRTGTQFSANWLGPTVLLLMRFWVELAFWRAGIVKLSDPYGTEFLFSTLYDVPLLSASAAAFLGMWVELIAPWLLGLGLGGRLTAVLLFVYNLIAVISYSALWPHGFFTGLFNTADFADHKIWALMLLAVIAWGPGKWSIDAMMVHLYQSRKNKPHIQSMKI